MLSQIDSLHCSAVKYLSIDACDGAIGGVEGSESDDNNKGIGFGRHDDTWLPLQSDFQSVLAALNIQHRDAGKEMSETEKKDNLKELSIYSQRSVFTIRSHVDRELYVLGSLQSSQQSSQHYDETVLAPAHHLHHGL